MSEANETRGEGRSGQLDSPKAPAGRLCERRGDETGEKEGETQGRKITLTPERHQLLVHSHLGVSAGAHATVPKRPGWEPACPQGAWQIYLQQPSSAPAIARGTS